MNKIILICLILTISSKKNTNNCDITTKRCNFYQITVIPKVGFTVSQYVLSDNVNFNDLPTDNLNNFLCKLYEKNTFSPMYITRKDYFTKCNLEYDGTEDQHFEAQFYKSFIKNSNCVKLKLKTGEKIKIKGVSIYGDFFRFLMDDDTKNKLSSINLFPNDCDNINEYYIPYQFFTIDKIKKSSN